MYLANGMIVPAHAEPQKTICVLQPIDQSISYRIVNQAVQTAEEHNATVKIIGLIEELTNKSNAGCGIVINMERTYNTNIWWKDKTIHYLIEGNVITLFTHKTPVSNGLGQGGQNDAIVSQMVMTSCYGLGERFPHMYGTQNDYMSNTECDPYQGQRHIKTEISSYVVEKAENTALAKFGL